MLHLLTKSVASLLLITNLHNGSNLKQIHYVVVNNQIPKITQVSYIRDKKKEDRKATKKKVQVVSHSKQQVSDNPKPKLQKVSKKVVKSKPSKTPQNGHTVTMDVSAYTYSGGVNGGHVCADGTAPEEGVTIAAGSQYSFGTKMIINDHTYTVQDRGSAIGPNDIDLFMTSEQAAVQFGRQELQVTVLD